MRKEFPTSLLLSSALASLFVYFEYYYITLNGVPYRELTHESLMQMPPYFWFPLLPAFLIVAFSPLVAHLAERSDLLQINRKLALSLANFLCAITVYDALFYAFRVLAPIPTDPLAGFGITPGEDSFAGLVNLFGTLVPTWYFITIPIFGSIYLAYYLTSHEPAKIIQQPNITSSELAARH